MRYVSLTDGNVECVVNANRDEFTPSIGEPNTPEFQPGGDLILWEGGRELKVYAHGTWRSCSEEPPHHLIPIPQRVYCHGTVENTWGEAINVIN